MADTSRFATAVAVSTLCVSLFGNWIQYRELKQKYTELAQKDAELKQAQEREQHHIQAQQNCRDDIDTQIAVQKSAVDAINRKLTDMDIDNRNLQIDMGVSQERFVRDQQRFQQLDAEHTKVFGDRKELQDKIQQLVLQKTRCD